MEDLLQPSLLGFGSSGFEAPDSGVWGSGVDLGLELGVSMGLELGV